MLQSILGTLQIDQLVEAASHVTNHALLYTAGALTLVGFGVKAGMYPLHTWLPQAHSSAPAPASAMLSAVITKAGIFGIIVVAVISFCMMHNGDWQSSFLVLVHGNRGSAGCILQQYQTYAGMFFCFTAWICHHRNWYAVYVGRA